MNSGQEPTASPENHQPRHVSCLDLIFGFAIVGMIGFGGIANALFHVVVDKRKWLTAEEYTMTFGFAQILPGASPINTSIMIADRFQGMLGIICAIAGLANKLRESERPRARGRHRETARPRARTNKRARAMRRGALLRDHNTI